MHFPIHNVFFLRFFNDKSQHDANSNLMCERVICDYEDILIILDGPLSNMTNGLGVCLLRQKKKKNVFSVSTDTHSISDQIVTSSVFAEYFGFLTLGKCVVWPFFHFSWFIFIWQWNTCRLCVVLICSSGNNCVETLMCSFRYRKIVTFSGWY